ncbi:MAG TPA: hypothetical protein VNV15_02480 [Opitutaceae bacterium]|jgi:hypothetical protein|nr:hypothetical protein [Opitutaceae bacterium]
MATKKKSFDAVAASRRWRIQTGRKLRGLSFAQQQVLLQRTTDALFAAKPSRRASALTHR